MMLKEKINDFAAGTPQLAECVLSSLCGQLVVEVLENQVSILSVRQYVLNGLFMYVSGAPGEAGPGLVRTRNPTLELR